MQNSLGVTIAGPPLEGALLPSFQLPAAGGDVVRLRAYRGKRRLLLFFLHGVCCAACGDLLSGALERYDVIAEAGGETLAILADTMGEAARLKASLALPFPVLADSDGAVFQRYALRPAEDAAVALTDRYGAPRVWQTAPPSHAPALPPLADLIAELNYLSITCNSG